jgi:hypothetical protein
MAQKGSRLLQEYDLEYDRIVEKLRRALKRFNQRKPGNPLDTDEIIK